MLNSIVSSLQSQKIKNISNDDDILELIDGVDQGANVNDMSSDIRRDTYVENDKGENLLESKMHSTNTLIPTDVAATTTAMFRQLRENTPPKKPKQANDTNSATHEVLEEMVSELIKPYLRDWLSENLPQIVQAAVEREIVHLREKESEYA